MCRALFTATLFIIAAIWKQCPLMDEQMKKWHACVHTHTHTNGILLNHKKVKSCHLVNIGEPGGYNAVKCQVRNEKYHMISLRYRI